MMRSRFSRFASAAIGAGLALALLVTSVTPAEAQSRTSTSFSFGLSVGDPYYRYRSAWNDPWMRDPWFYGAPRRGVRSSWSCLNDPFCYRPARSVWRGPVYAPPPVYMAPPPVVIYDSRDMYDPMPRWRAVAPQTSTYQQPYQQQPWQQPAQQQPIYQQPYYAGAARPFGEPPATMGDGVRFDLVQQGYTASDLGTGYNPAYDPYGAAPGVRFDQSGGYNGYNPGAADSYIRDPWASPNDTLLGGPR